MAELQLQAQCQDAALPFAQEFLEPGERGQGWLIEARGFSVMFASAGAMLALGSLVFVGGLPLEEALDIEAFDLADNLMLARAVARVQGLGFTPVFACELEFYLLRRLDDGQLVPAGPDATVWKPNAFFCTRRRMSFAGNR